MMVIFYHAISPFDLEISPVGEIGQFQMLVILYCDRSEVQHVQSNSVIDCGQSQVQVSAVHFSRHKQTSLSLHALVEFVFVFSLSCIVFCHLGQLREFKRYSVPRILSSSDM